MNKKKTLIQVLLPIRPNGLYRPIGIITLYVTKPLRKYFSSQNALKLTYSKVEFQNFPAIKSRTPLQEDGVQIKGQVQI
jgi:hypothetical protein